MHMFASIEEMVENFFYNICTYPNKIFLQAKIYAYAVISSQVILKKKATVI